MSSIAIDLGYKPRAWQQKVHELRRSRTVVAAHRRSGKTQLALRQLVDDALQCTRSASLFAFIAPQRNQAKAVAWDELKRIVAPLGASLLDIRESELTVRFTHNNASVTLFGADNNGDALRGLRFDAVAIDEFAQIQPAVWSAVILPALADRKGTALLIGTPAGLDAFSEAFFGAAERPDWIALRFTCYDTNALDPAEVARLQRDMPPEQFAREMLCDFSASGDDQVLSLGDVEAAAHRSYSESDVAGMPRVIGCDPARFGNDRSVIVKRQGLQMFKPIVLKGVDNMELAARLVHEVHAWSPDAVFVDAGQGGGVIDRLRQLGLNPKEVPFGGKAQKEDGFVNRRSEMWWRMREWILAGGAIPDDMALKSELATPVYEFDARGRVKLESKDDIKKRLQAAGSPDIADALALTFAAKVRVVSPLEAEARRVRKHQRKDPSRSRTPAPRRSGVDYARLRDTRGWNPFAPQNRGN